MDLREIRTELNIKEQRVYQVADYTPLHPSTRSWEVPRDRVSVEKIIGKGAFGQVAKGTAEKLRGRPGRTTVAIKMLKSMIFHIVKIVYIQLKFSCFRYSFLPSMLLRWFLLFFLSKCEHDNTYSIIHAWRACKSYALLVCSSQTARHYVHRHVLKNACVGVWSANFV